MARLILFLTISKSVIVAVYSSLLKAEAWENGNTHGQKGLLIESISAPECLFIGLAAGSSAISCAESC